MNRLVPGNVTKPQWRAPCRYRKRHGTHTPAYSCPRALSTISGQLIQNSEIGLFLAKKDLISAAS
jgi:hypothetical protein